MEKRDHQVEKTLTSSITQLALSRLGNSLTAPLKSPVIPHPPAFAGVGLLSKPSASQQRVVSKRVSQRNDYGTLMGLKQPRRERELEAQLPGIR
ncbi:MAG: hypothetical protein L0312_26940 [Acidobacteria bacterium]|nr:hypothetical protein [Acidobacteriota bacterium]